MATHGSQHIQPGGSRPEDDNHDEATTAGTQQLNITGTDDLLDEIDGLLEANAEEFVRSYVQKGGQ